MRTVTSDMHSVVAWGRCGLILRVLSFVGCDACPCPSLRRCWSVSFAEGTGLLSYRSHYGDLSVHSEAELDAALSAIDHKLHHETVPLAVEKKLIAEHKRLEQQRQRVRNLAASASCCIQRFFTLPGFLPLRLQDLCTFQRLSVSNDPQWLQLAETEPSSCCRSVSMRHS